MLEKFRPRFGHSLWEVAISANLRVRPPFGGCVGDSFTDREFACVGIETDVDRMFEVSRRRYVNLSFRCKQFSYPRGARGPPSSSYRLSTFQIDFYRLSTFSFLLL